MPDIGSAVRCPRHLFLHLPHGGVEVEGGGVVRQPIGVQVSREVVLVFQPVWHCFQSTPTLWLLALWLVMRQLRLAL